MTPDASNPLAIAAADPVAQAVVGTSSAEPQDDGEMLKEMREMNRLLQLNVRAQTGIKERLLAGLFTGLGTVLGATVVIGLLVKLLSPLAKAEVVGPYFQKIQDQLERPRPDKSGASDGEASGDSGASQLRIKRLELQIERLRAENRRAAKPAP